MALILFDDLDSALSHADLLGACPLPEEAEVDRMAASIAAGCLVRNADVFLQRVDEEFGLWSAGEGGRAGLNLRPLTAYAGWRLGYVWIDGAQALPAFVAVRVGSCGEGAGSLPASPRNAGATFGRPILDRRPAMRRRILAAMGEAPPAEAERFAELLAEVLYRIPRVMFWLQALIRAGGPKGEQWLPSLDAFVHALSRLSATITTYAEVTEALQTCRPDWLR